MFLEGFIDNYSNTLREIKQSINELEPDRNGVIREDFLAGGVQRGLKRAEHVAMMLTDEANAVLRSVRDIIDVRDLDDGEFLDKVQHAKKMTYKTIEKLYLFDRHNTAKLEPVEQDLHTMKNYVSRIRELGNSGQINIATYQARKIADQKIHQQLMQGLMKKAGKNAIDLEVIMGELGKRLFSKFIPLAAIPINYLQKHFGLKTIDYSYRAIHATLAATGDSLTASEFSTIEHLVISKVKVSDYKGVRQGTYYTLADGRKVRKFESETGINYELVHTIPASRQKPKDPEKSWLQKAADGTKNAFVKAREFSAAAVKETADFLILDDVNTILDSEASKKERIIAGASIIPHGKVLKLIKAGGTIKFVNKGGITAKRKPLQRHHYATNKSKKYTPKIEKITKKYGLDLDGDWNKELLPHQGRHPNAYHEFVLQRIIAFDKVAKGDKEKFLRLYERLKEEVRKNPDMLYKDYWRSK